MNGTVLHSKVLHLSRFYNTRLRATLFGCTVHPSIDYKKNICGERLCDTKQVDAEYWAATQTKPYR